MEKVKETVMITIIKQIGVRPEVFLSTPYRTNHEVSAKNFDDMCDFMDKVIIAFINNGYRFIQPLPFDWSILLKDEYVVKVMMYLPEPKPNKK